MAKNHILGSQSMTINVDEYVDHLYIHYKTQTAKHLAGQVASIFTPIRDKAVENASSNITADQLNAMLVTMNQQTPAAESMEKIIKSITDGSELEQTLNQIAAMMNDAILREYGNAYNKTIETMQSTYNNLLSKGPMGADNAAAFFNQIDQALQLIGENANNAELSAFKALQKIFATGEGWNESQDELTAVSKDAVSAAAKIVKYLSSAAEKLTTSDSHSVSQASFGSTITQIFSTVIGEELARQMIQTALQDIESKTGEILINGLQKVKRSQDRIEVSQAGTDRFQSNNQKRTSKVNIITSNVFTLSTMINGQTVEIQVGTNASVQWQQTKSRKIHLVGGTRIATVFDIMGLDNNARHVAYNVIAHRYSPNFTTGSTSSRQGDFYQAYNTIRASVAATFFTQWLAGSGSPLGHGGIDKAQFLMYNGRIYSVMSIIKAICDNLESNSRYKKVNAEIQGVDKIDNSFQGAEDPDDITKHDMNYVWANKRSEQVTAVINTLTIAGSLNANILANILPKI